MLMMFSRRCFTASAALAALSPAFVRAAVAPAPNSKVSAVTTEKKIGRLTIVTRDLSPQFLDFFSRAQGADEAMRLALWKQYYGFAAVPPTPEGEAMVKGMLASAWDKYPTAVPRIRKGAAALSPAPSTMIQRIASLLDFDASARIDVIAFVGMFEMNAFTYRDGASPTLALPIEAPDEFIGFVGLHEAAHAIHILAADLSGGYERKVGRVIFEEGLALRVVEALTPGLPEAGYVTRTPGWFETATSKRRAILEGLAHDLDASDGATVFKYTGGTGSTGLQREAYYAGWLVVDALRRQGRSFPELARIPEAQIPALVGATISTLLRS